MENFEPNLTPKTIENLDKTFHEAEPVISEEGLKKLCGGNEYLESLYENFMDYCIRYAKDVWTMEEEVQNGLLNTDEGAKKFAEMDDSRSILHSALIDSIAMLSRNLAKEGKDNEWVRELTTDGITLERPKCGAFALILVYKRYIDTV